MWVGTDVIGLLSANVGSLSNNVGPEARILSLNVVPRTTMLSVPAPDIISPLHLVMELCCSLHNFRVRLTPWQPMV